MDPRHRASVRTRAKGLLARLAHDLEIAAGATPGRVEVGESAWSGELVVPVAKLAVAGSLHGDRLDPSGLSPGDRAEVERRIRDEVLAARRRSPCRPRGATREEGKRRWRSGAGRGRGFLCG